MFIRFIADDRRAFRSAIDGACWTLGFAFAGAAGASGVRGFGTALGGVRLHTRMAGWGVEVRRVGKAG